MVLMIQSDYEFGLEQMDIGRSRVPRSDPFDPAGMRMGERVMGWAGPFNFATATGRRRDRGQEMKPAPSMFARLAFIVLSAFAMLMLWNVLRSVFSSSAFAPQAGQLADSPKLEAAVKDVRGSTLHSSEEEGQVPTAKFADAASRAVASVSLNVTISEAVNATVSAEGPAKVAGQPDDMPAQTGLLPNATTSRAVGEIKAQQSSVTESEGGSGVKQEKHGGKPAQVRMISGPISVSSNSSSSSVSSPSRNTTMPETRSAAKESKEPNRQPSFLQTSASSLRGAAAAASRSPGAGSLARAARGGLF